MGEFLTSKAGIGYLILYGSQVFNLDLVMSGIFILIIISVVLYLLINSIKKILWLVSKNFYIFPCLFSILLSLFLYLIILINLNIS